MVSYNWDGFIKELVEHQLKIEELSSRSVETYIDLDSKIDTLFILIEDLEREVHSVKCDGELIRECVGDKIHFRCPKCNKHIKKRFYTRGRECQL